MLFLLIIKEYHNYAASPADLLALLKVTYLIGIQLHSQPKGALRVDLHGHKTEGNVPSWSELSILVDCHTQLNTTTLADFTCGLMAHLFRDLPVRTVERESDTSELVLILR